MTREEVIQYMKDSYAIGNDEDSRHHNEVMDYLISALSAEGEYIKKEDALSDKGLAEFHYYEDYYKMRKYLESLPTYSFPDREKGIADSYRQKMFAYLDGVADGLNNPIRENGEWIYDGDCIHCNNCKSAFNNLTGFNFCPNCGTDMRGEK